MFVISATHVKAAAPVAVKASAKKAEKKSSFVGAKVAATAAAILLASGPAHADRLGLTIENGTGEAPGKYEQPFYDPRPVVRVQKDGPGDVTREDARIMPNVQRGPAGCKLMNGSPCADFVTGK